MIKLTAKREVRFSIIVIFFGIVLCIMTFFFPWISFQELSDGEKDFNLNLEMMKDSTYPEIKNIVNKLNVINSLLWFIIIMGLLSFLSVSYHSATKNSHIGFYLMILSNIFIIIVAFLIVYLYFSVITYIYNTGTIALSSPCPYFSYSFFSLIGSVIFLIISVMYGGYITILTTKHLKDLISGRKEEKSFSIYDLPSGDKNLGFKKLQSDEVSGLYNITEKNDKLPAFSIKESEETEEEISDKFDKESPVLFSFGETNEISEIKDQVNGDEISNHKEKKTPKPFSFNKPKQKIQEARKDEVTTDGLREKKAKPFSFNKSKNKAQVKEENINIGLSKENLNGINNQNKDEIKKSQYIENTNDIEKDSIYKSLQEEDKSQKIEGITQENSQINIILDKKTYTVRCPQCKHIFHAEKLGEITQVKCPMCGNQGVIK